MSVHTLFGCKYSKTYFGYNFFEEKNEAKPFFSHF